MSKPPVSTSVSLGVFFVGSILLWADRTNFSVAAAVWAKQYGWTPTLFGTLASAFTLGYLIMTPFGGAIADRIGPRKTVALSTAGWSFWVLLTPLGVVVQPLLFACRALLGVFEAPFIPGYMVGVSKAFPLGSQRARPLSLLNCGSYLGPALGTFFAAAILGATNSPGMVFVIFGIVGFVLAAAWWLYAMRHSDPAPSATAAQSPEAKARSADVPVPLRMLLFRGNLWPLFLGFLAVPYCNYIFLAWLPQYLTKYRHLPVVQAGLLASIPYFAAAACMLGAGFLLDWFARKGWKGGWFAAYRKSPVYVGALVFAVAGFFSPIISGVVAERTGAFVAPLQIAVGVIIAGAVLMVFVRLRPLSEQMGTPPVPVPA